MKKISFKNTLKEIEKLKSRGIKVIAVHALANYRQNSKWFYETLAKEIIYLPDLDKNLVEKILQK